MSTVFFNRYSKVLSHNIYDTNISLQSTKSPSSGCNSAKPMKYYRTLEWGLPSMYSVG
jgi:hypothetical protein